MDLTGTYRLLAVLLTAPDPSAAPAEPVLTDEARSWVALAGEECAHD